MALEFITLACSLDSICSSRNLYVRCDPEVLDYTTNGDNALIVENAEKLVRIPLPPKHLRSILGLLRPVFRKEQSLMTWKLKNFLTYARYHTRVDFDFEANALDLHAVEGFLGTHDPMPADFVAAAMRTKAVLTSPGWTKAKIAYRRVHLPLITKILPAIETAGVWDSVKKKRLHPYYEVEGQANGRLKCEKVWDDWFNPHSILPEEKETFRSFVSEVGEVFVYFDYKHNEVSFLQWLSKDERLGEILKSDKDFYSEVFKVITGQECTTEKQRQVCKDLFLPIFYGFSAMSLANEKNVSLTLAEKIIDRIHNLFPVAMDWISQVQDGDVFQDYFGHLRVMADRRYRAGTFSYRHQPLWCALINSFDCMMLLLVMAALSHISMTVISLPQPHSLVNPLSR